MKREIAMAWVEALRSESYKQGQNFLAAYHAYCCLGVLCHVVKAPSTGLLSGVVRFDGTASVVPESVRTATGLSECAGTRSDRGRIQIGENFYSDLAEANDRGVPFTQIADYIEENWEAL